MYKSNAARRKINDARTHVKYFDWGEEEREGGGEYPLWASQSAERRRGSGGGRENGS